MNLTNSFSTICFILLIAVLSACQNQSSPLSKFSQEHRQSLIRSNNVVFYAPVQQKVKLDEHAKGMPVGNGAFGGVLFIDRSSLAIQLNHTDFWRYDSLTKVFPQYGARPFGLGNLNVTWKGFKNAEYFQELDLLEATINTSLRLEKDSMSIKSYFDANADLALFSFQIKPELVEDSLVISLEAWRDEAITVIDNNLGVIYDPPQLARSLDEINYIRKLKNEYDTLYSTQALAIKLLEGRLGNCI
jgi:hypothetical protein